MWHGPFEIKAGTTLKQAKNNELYNKRCFQQFLEDLFVEIKKKCLDKKKTKNKKVEGCFVFTYRGGNYFKVFFTDINLNSQKKLQYDETLLSIPKVVV